MVEGIYLKKSCLLCDKEAAPWFGRGRRSVYCVDHKVSRPAVSKPLLGWGKGECEGCGKLYKKERMNQTCCTTKCSNARDRKRQKERVKQRTQEVFDTLLAEQGGVCAGGCGRTAETDRRLSVDHDHKTGAVRGILCFHCNTVLGKVKDDPFQLRFLADYLDMHREEPRQGLRYHKKYLRSIPAPGVAQD